MLLLMLVLFVQVMVVYDLFWNMVILLERKKFLGFVLVICCVVGEDFVVIRLVYSLMLVSVFGDLQLFFVLLVEIILLLVCVIELQKFFWLYWLVVMLNCFFVGLVSFVVVVVKFFYVQLVEGYFMLVVLNSVLLYQSVMVLKFFGVLYSLLLQVQRLISFFGQLLVLMLLLLSGVSCLFEVQSWKFGLFIQKMFVVELFVVVVCSLVKYFLYGVIWMLIVMFGCFLVNVVVMFFIVGFWFLFQMVQFRVMFLLDLVLVDLEEQVLRVRMVIVDVVRVFRVWWVVWGIDVFFDRCGIVGIGCVNCLVLNDQ